MSVEIPVMFGLAVLSVSMFTLRVALAANGLKLACSLIAAVEAVIFVSTFSRLAADLGSPGRILGYAAGVGVGTAVGLLINDRATRGHTELHLVAYGDRTDVVDSIRDRGWPATSTVACGPDGQVTMMWLTVADTEVADVTSLVRQRAPQAFWTLRRLHKAVLSPEAPMQQPSATVVPVALVAQAGSARSAADRQVPSAQDPNRSNPEWSKP